MPQFFFKTASGQPDFSTAVCVEAFEPSRPYPKNPTAIIYRARFMQLRAYYTRPAANTPHPDVPCALFVDDTEFKDDRSGVMSWVRVWATLPKSWSDYDTHPYTWPSYIANNTNAIGTNTIFKPVTSYATTARLDYDYFVTGPSLAPNYVNSLASPDDFSNTAWSKVNAVAAVLTNGGPASANYPGASSLTENAVSGRRYALQGSAQNGLLPGGVFVRKNTGNAVKIAVVAAASPNFNASYATVDLNTGLLLANSSDAAARVAAVGEGWWRIVVEKLNSNYSNAALAVVFCDDSGNDNTTGTGRIIDVWRGQIGTAPTLAYPTDATFFNNVNYTDAGSIPSYNATNFVYGFAIETSAGVVTGVSGQLPFLTDQTNVPNTNNVLYTPSVPSATNYRANVAADRNGNTFSIEANDSELGEYLGSLWQRRRRYVKAR